MVRVNNFITEGVIPGVEKTLKRSGKAVTECLSRDMQMVPKYLEMATVKGKYRFSAEETKELTKMIRGYETEIPVTDLVKQLLNIGTEKGEPLTIKEIKDFLQATSGLSKDGQSRVMRFMKTMKEKDTFKYDADYIKNTHTFEAFKKKVESGEYSLYKDYSEEQLRLAFRERLRHELDLCQYKAYTSQFERGPIGTSQFVSYKNRGFVLAIAKCEKPEVLAQIVEKAGIREEVITMVPNSLVQAFEMSGGNINLIQDLARGFYPLEIKQIVAKLSEHRGIKDLSKYNPKTYEPDDVMAPRLSTQRNRVIKALGLTGEIDLLPLATYRMPRAKFYRGSFEQGKRR